MTKRVAGWSPRLKARVAGVFEALEGTASAGGQVVILGSLVVEGSAAKTAANILANQPLFWLGFTASLLGVAFHITWAVLFYDLLKPVNRSLSLLAFASYSWDARCRLLAASCTSPPCSSCKVGAHSAPLRRPSCRISRSCFST